MKIHKVPLANVITLGTQHLPVLRDFYRQLGWPILMDGDEYAAFELQGTVLALFPLDKLAADGRAHPQRSLEGIRFTIGIMVDSPDEVDTLTDRVRQAGGRVTKEPVDAEFFVGRSAYFADPEGNYWEIAWTPPDNPIIAAARRAAILASLKRLAEAGLSAIAIACAFLPVVPELEGVGRRVRQSRPLIKRTQEEDALCRSRTSRLCLIHKPIPMTNPL